MKNVLSENKTPNLFAIVDLVKAQHPNRLDLIAGLQNAGIGEWTSKGYYRFVSSANANELGAEWQIDESIVIEQNSNGDIVIDLLKDGRIGGLEFIDLI